MNESLDQRTTNDPHVSCPLFVVFPLLCFSLVSLHSRLSLFFFLSLSFSLTIALDKLFHYAIQHINYVCFSFRLLPCYIFPFLTGYVCVYEQAHLTKVKEEQDFVLWRLIIMVFSFLLNAKKTTPTHD